MNNRNETRELGARRETIEDLQALLPLIQNKGKKLAGESHGDSYDQVRQLNELLHQASNKIKLIVTTQVGRTE